MCDEYIYVYIKVILIDDPYLNMEDSKREMDGENEKKSSGNGGTLAKWRICVR